MSDANASSSDDPVQPAGVERRRSLRHQLRVKRSCYLHVPEDKVIGPVKIVNISTNGICLALSQPLDSQSIITVSLYNRAGQFWSEVQVRLLHTTRARQGQVYQGGAFIVPLAADDLQRLL